MGKVKYKEQYDGRDVARKVTQIAHALSTCTDEERKRKAIAIAFKAMARMHGILLGPPPPVNTPTKEADG